MEIWKNYYQNHSISNIGRVKALKREWINGLGIHRITEERLLKPYKHKTGYYCIDINGKKCLKLHRLVASLFIPNPHNLPQINHIDGDKTNNVVNNLEWCDNSHNQKHAYKMGLQPIRKGDNNGNRLLSEKQVLEIRGKYKPHEYTRKKLAQEYGVTIYCINHIVFNENWKV